MATGAVVCTVSSSTIHEPFHSCSSAQALVSMDFAIGVLTKATAEHAEAMLAALKQLAPERACE